ncbi:vWA domain-containing protein [Tepidimonas alkaliphilus]|uniref:vWA domain-containing protein n=1 Tax=Tepidimonas alkaliphilus TaxID=2588942 RepID=UPI00163D6D05|nr:VWA domain-containing protein [Tepidimonas alkaliphilus]
MAPEPACLHVVVLDASGSMLRRGRLARAKAVALALLQRAARCGHHVALLLASGQGAQVLQPPAPARRALGVTVRAVGGGGGTPLAAALQRAETLAKGWARRVGGRAQRVLWLLTDGRVRQAPPRPALEVCVVVDADDDRPPLGQARQWAQRWQAHHVALNDWN